MGEKETQATWAAQMVFATMAFPYMVASWGPGLAVRKEAAFAQLRRELSCVRSRRGLRAAKRAASSPSARFAGRRSEVVLCANCDGEAAARDGEESESERERERGRDGEGAGCEFRKEGGM